MPVRCHHQVASINRGPFGGCPHIVRALLFGVRIRAPDGWKLPSPEQTADAGAVFAQDRLPTVDENSSEDEEEDVSGMVPWDGAPKKGFHLKVLSNPISYSHVGRERSRRNIQFHFVSWRTLLHYIALYHVISYVYIYIHTCTQKRDTYTYIYI